MNILPTVIILEGNISAGKTSLARDLGNMLDYHVFFEPTITNPYLEKFYAGMLINNKMK
jgi:deoxyadenosine/deoxycytidine kinase